MHTEMILLLGLVLLLGVIGARFTFLAPGYRQAGIKSLAESGTLFILMGYLIGNEGLGLITLHVLEDAQPILLFAFGWLGFLYGSHFQARLLRRFPLRMYLGGAAIALGTVISVAGLLWLMIPYSGLALSESSRLAMAIALGLCSAGTAPAGVFMLQQDRSIARGDIKNLEFLSAIDDIAPLFILGGVFAWFWAPDFAWEATFIRFGISIIAGGTIGLVTHWLLPLRKSEATSELLLIGIVAFGVGAATLLKLSALFVCFFAGLVFANLSNRTESAYGVMSRREYTIYSIFLMLAGALMRFESQTALVYLIPAYLGVRAIAKVILSRLVAPRVFLLTQPHPWMGVGLLFQGGMAVVMAVHLEHGMQHTFGHLVMSIVIASLLFNDILTAPFAASILRKRYTVVAP